MSESHNNGDIINCKFFLFSINQMHLAEKPNGSYLNDQTENSQNDQSQTPLKITETVQNDFEVIN